MLGWQFGKPLYELRPDLFPYGRMAPLEEELWRLHINTMK
jgi:hypothetical protein